MSGSPLSGTGLDLPIPQNLFPSELYGAPGDYSNAQITLPPGEAVYIPRGSFVLSAGIVSTLQYQDPVTQVWRGVTPARRTAFIFSDGQNYRIANLLGIPIGAVVTASGSGYAQATTTVTAGAGNSVWTPIIGGKLAVSTISVAGAGFSVQPIVAIPGPPTFAANGVGGIQASAYATLTNGTVSGVTLLNVGAGYVGTISAVLLPNPYDPNFIAGTTTPGTVVFTAGGAGSLTGVLLINGGQSVSLTTTLAVSGAGTSATAAPQIPRTVTAVTVSAAGATYGTIGPLVTSSGGGNTSSDAIGNPSLSLTGFNPLPFYGVGVLGTQTLASVTILDGGYFLSTPNPIVIPGTGVNPVTASVASVTFAMGTTNDTVFVQPAG